MQTIMKEKQTLDGERERFPLSTGGGCPPRRGDVNISRPPRQGRGAGARVRSCRAGRPFTGLPRAQPHKALALDGVIWFSIPATGTPTSLTPVSQWRGTVVVLSLCEAAKREFGGFVQPVFRGFTSTIKLGVFEHSTWGVLGASWGWASESVHYTVYPH